MSRIHNNRAIIIRSLDQPDQSSCTFDFDDDQTYRNIGVITERLVVNEIALTSGYVKNLIPNLRPDSRLIMDIVGDQHTVVFEEGLYNVQQVYTKILDSLIVSGIIDDQTPDTHLPILMNYSEASGILRITTNDDTQLTFEGPIAKMLGLGVLGSGQSISLIPNMNTTRVIHVRLNNVTGSMLNGHRGSLIASFLPSHYYGEMMQITPLIPMYLPLSSEKIDTNNITLLYEDGSRVRFTEGATDCLHMTFHLRQRSI